MRRRAGRSPPSPRRRGAIDEHPAKRSGQGHVTERGAQGAALEEDVRLDGLLGERVPGRRVGSEVGVIARDLDDRSR